MRLKKELLNLQESCQKKYIYNTMKMLFLKLIKVFIIIIFFQFGLVSKSLSEYINVYQWDYLKLSADDIIPYKDSSIIVLKKNKKSVIINISTLSEKPIAGAFTKIRFGPNNKILGLHKNKSLYNFSKLPGSSPIWKKINLNLNKKINDFSISHNAIHSIEKGKIKSYSFNGKRTIFNSLTKLKNIKQILFLDYNMVLLLENNGNLKILRTKKERLKKTIKKRIRSVIQPYEWNRNYNKKKYKNNYQKKTYRKLNLSNKININYEFLRNFKSKKIQNNVSKILFANEKHAYVIQKNNTIIFFDFTKRKIQSFKNKNSIKIKSLIQNSYGNIIAVDGKKLYVSKINVEQLDTKENKKKYIEKNLTFKKLNIEASKIFNGPDGIFIINRLGLLQLINTNKKFVTISGRLKNISNPGNGEIWGINYLGRIFYFKNKKWVQIKGLAKSISSKGPKVLIVDENNLVKEFNWKTKKFINLRIKAEKVFLQDSQNYWILNDNIIYSCIKKICKRKSGKFKKISISPEGVVFALNMNNQLERYNGKIFKKVKTNAKDIIDFIAIKNAEVILINKDYNLLTSNKKNLIVANKKNVKYFLSNNYDENATIGKGFSILRGKKTSLSQMSNSVAHSLQGFKYKSRFNVEKISNSHYFLDFNMGRDNRLWGVSAYNTIFQYHLKNKAFLSYTSSNFQSADQKHLGVPPVSIQRIISDKHERIWAVQDTSKTVYYQEHKKGLFKYTSISNAHHNISDITVDDHGNVYVAAGEIFKWSYKKKKFEKFISNNNYNKISSGLPGTLWAINEDRNIYEYFNGKMNKRNKRGGKIEGQDIDVSTSGIVYATTRSHDTLSNIPEGFGTYETEGHEGHHIKCELYKYNPVKKVFEQVWKKGSDYAQLVAIAEDGSPWTSRASCQNNHIYKPK